MLGASPRMAALWMLLTALAAPDAARTADAAGIVRELPPWHASPGTTIDAEERTFENGSATLSGTLFAPRGDGRIPVVIVLHAASSPERDSPLYRHLVEMLPPMNVAVFLFDRRGSGRSGGKLAESDYELLADDGIAALRLLAQDARIDPRRIGFWGLSQGGWLALLAASRSPEAAFAVAVSAPMTTPDVQMNFAVANILRIKGYPPSDIEHAVTARTAVDDFLLGRLDRATAQQTLDAAVTRPWFEHVYLPRMLEDPQRSRWAREMRHDPLSVMNAVKQRVLMIYGSVDPWVPVQASVDRLRAEPARFPAVDVAVIAGADHTMSTTVSATDQIDPDLFPRAAPDSSSYFGLLGAWLTRQGIASPPMRK